MQPVLQVRKITDDYSLKRCDRNRNGGGVALYVRNTVNFKPREDFPNKSLELVCIEVEPKNSLPLIILGWYRPPNNLGLLLVAVTPFRCITKLSKSAHGNDDNWEAENGK